MLLRGRYLVLCGRREEAVDLWLSGAQKAHRCRLHGERMLLLHQLAVLVEVENMDVEPSTLQLCR